MDSTITVKKNGGFFKKRIKAFMAGCASIYAALYCTMFTAFAKFGDTTVTPKDGVDADQAAGKVIGLLLDITRWAGVALAVYGVYEVVMSFMQNQPEAKTKGIIMALCGMVMIAMKSLLGQLGVV